MLGLDTDNDSVFINESLLKYSKETGLALTRSRAYKKNDQAWVEQKNGAVVRRLVGYGRLKGIKATQILTRLYSASRLYVNCFQPSFKLKEKSRHGAKVTKRYQPPATPYQRLASSKALEDSEMHHLTALAKDLDPLRLLNEIRTQQAALSSILEPDAASSTSSSDNDLALFLAQLPTLWHAGEPRPTHREPPPSNRYWRTRIDPFAPVWEVVKGWLEQEPDATAKSLLDRLRQEHPSTYSPGQLRTLQRRVRKWRRDMARELIFGGAKLHPRAPSFPTTNTANGSSEASSVPGNIPS